MKFNESERLLSEYVKTSEIKMHCLEVSQIMQFLAKELNENEEEWAITGLLHDLDYESCTIESHATKCAEILREKTDLKEELIHAILSHNEEYSKIKRETRIDYALAACDNISGMIYAYALMRKGFQGMDVRGLKKKIKDKRFAANVRRDLIYDIENEKVGISLDNFLDIAIKAMQNISSELGFVN